jgi:hypothetical protein
VEKVKPTFFETNVDERDGVRKFSVEKLEERWLLMTKRKSLLPLKLNMHSFKQRWRHKALLLAI